MKRIISVTALLSVVTLFAASSVQRYEPVSLDLKKDAYVSVEIKGEVRRPGVYTMPAGTTVENLIEQAGGKTEKADLSGTALSQQLDSNDMIIIPEITEEKKISINSASLEELTTLDGIGPATAQKIIDYRSEHRFLNLEQLMEVKGIGQKTFDKLKDFISL